jgi:hypothetical protein
VRDALAACVANGRLLEAADAAGAQVHFAERNGGLAIPPAVILIAAMGIGEREAQTLRELRDGAATREVPIVLFALGDASDAPDAIALARAYDCGASSVVCLGAEAAEFAAGVAQVAGYWLRLNEPLPSRRNFTVY